MPGVLRFGCRRDDGEHVRRIDGEPVFVVRAGQRPSAEVQGLRGRLVVGMDGRSIGAPGFEQPACAHARAVALEPRHQTIEQRTRLGEAPPQSECACDLRLHFESERGRHARVVEQGAKPRFGPGGIAEIPQGIEGVQVVHVGGGVRLNAHRRDRPRAPPGRSSACQPALAR